MQSPQFSRYLVRPRSKYSPQHRDGEIVPFLRESGWNLALTTHFILSRVREWVEIQGQIQGQIPLYVNLYLIC